MPGGRSPEGKPPDPQPRRPVWGLRRPEAGSTPGTLGSLPNREVIPGLFLTPIQSDLCSSDNFIPRAQSALPSRPLTHRTIFPFGL